LTTNRHNPQPADAYEDQERRFPVAFGIINEAIAARGFPGASIAVTYRGDIVALKGFGRFTFGKDSARVDSTTIYDLASLTKVLATTAMAMLLHVRGELDLQAKVVDLLPEFDTGDERRKAITLRMLLAHSSGLPAYERLFERAKTREDLLRLAVTLPLASDPMTHAEYSDLGFILLGEILAKLAAEPLDEFCYHEIFEPLDMKDTGYCPGNDVRDRIPPTVKDETFRKKIVHGEVHDENAWVMGGISGHAGLFGTARDVARFALCMLRLGSPILQSQTVTLFTRREEAPPGTTRALGWDTPSKPSQSGQYLSSRSFGHLGYTGTSLWCDPGRQLSITLLTNRVWPDCSSQAIKEVRPRFHDAIIEALEGSQG
jgi:CubicO group peptidase (beta-lactamase class C family)